MTAFALSVSGIFLLIPLVPLVAYLAILYWLPRRRLLAILLSPLAVVFMFFFVESAVGTLGVVLTGVAYGISIWFPHGPRAWWRKRPKLIVVAAAGWIAVLVTIGLVQPLSAGVQSDLRGTVRDGERVGRFRLACEYDRAGRLRGTATGSTHPGGERACELLEDVYDGVFNGPPVLQEGCPRGAPVATYDGTIRGRRVDVEIVAGPLRGRLVRLRPKRRPGSLPAVVMSRRWRSPASTPSSTRPSRKPCGPSFVTSSAGTTSTRATTG